MDIPILTVLVGLPATGKSTYCAEVRLCRPHCVILSTDDFVEARARELGKTYNDIWADTIKEAEDDMWLQFDRAVSSRKDVMVDRTNLTVKARRRILSRVSPKIYRCYAVVFELPEDVRQVRAAQRVGKYIPDSVIQNMRSTYVKPTTTEGFVFVAVESYEAHA